MDDIVESVIENHRAERTTLAKELMAEIYAKIPFGEEFKLANGGTATVVPFGKLQDDGAFGFDFRLTGCAQDHIECHVKITGGGGGCVGHSMEPKDG